MTDIKGITSDIRHDLGGTGWFGLTTSGDVHNADREIEGLNAQDTNAVIAGLSDQDLASWQGNATSKAPWDGLSAGERRDLLNDLAGKLDGKQLARVAKAFGYDDVTSAVPSHASPGTQSEYVKALASQITSDPQYHAGLGVSTFTYGNDAARSAARVLAGLGGNQPAFDQAVQSLQASGKLTDVLNVAGGRTDVQVSGAIDGGTTSFDPSQLQRIINNASHSKDLAVRADVFKAATSPLRDMQGAGADQAANVTAKAMSNLLTEQQARAAHLVPQVPVKPPRVSLQQNIAQARKNGPIWVTKDEVPNKHPWDYKQRGAQYQNFGNFNYGVAEAAAGLPENIALRGAGWAQREAGTSQPNWGAPWDLNGGPYGDDPADQAQIKAGYEYYNSGLWRLWTQ